MTSAYASPVIYSTTAAYTANLPNLCIASSCPTLKPDVVFFGEGVPGDRVRHAMAALEAADAMLVVGSSLMVYSGYRFATAMADAGKPIAAVNLGRTRADDLLELKVTDRCADALSFLLRDEAPVSSFP